MGGEWLSFPSSSLLNGVRGEELGSSLPTPHPTPPPPYLLRLRLEPFQLGGPFHLGLPCSGEGHRCGGC